MAAEGNDGGARGGTVEPANRAAVARQVFQMPNEPAGTRYELRDPFAEVTYRAGSFAEMATKADQLGATRFQRIAADGSRASITKSGDQWKEPQGREDPTRSRTETAQPVLKVVQTNPTMPTTSEAVLAKIDADAERAARVARLEAALFERYVIKRGAVKVGELSVGQTEYRYRGDANRVAFTETTFRLASDNNNPSVIRSMVDVAEARQWQGLRVSGSEDFKRMVWLEASLRGVKALGYEPQLADQELLKRERESRARNHIEPIAHGREKASELTSPPDGQAKAANRGGGGRKTVLAALEAVLVANNVPQKQREAVMAAAADKLARRLSAGEVHKVKVFDSAAPRTRAPTAPAREITRSREQAAPVR